MNLQKLETCLRQCDIDWAELRQEFKCKEKVVHAIAEGGFPLVLRLFHAAFFDLEQKDSVSGLTPMHYAAGSGREESIRVLHELGASVAQADNSGWTPMLYAAWGGNLNLIQLGADVNQANIDGHSPMHFVAWRWNVELIRFLHELGASVNQADKNGRTPIQNAVERGHVEAATALLSAGAD